MYKSVELNKLLSQYMIQISVARVSDLFLFNPTALSLPASLKKSSKENGLALTFFPLKTCGSPVTTVNNKK